MNRYRLVVDPVRCVGHGVCAETIPQWLTLDEWGYPIVPPRPVRPSLLPLAREAVVICPALALHLVVEDR
ncbi:MAG: ferredoxin [Pseudonocardia sp.]|nr:ferredoxin [Pseudonocardia sp.]